METLGSAHPYTELLSVEELLQKGRNADGNQYFMLGFFLDYNPSTGMGKLKNPAHIRSQGISVDLTGIQVTEMAVDDQLCRVFGRCLWRDDEIVMQVHSIKNALRWDCHLYQDIVQKLQHQIHKSC